MNYLIIISSILFTFSGCISNRYIKNTSFKNTLLYKNQDSISFYRGHKVALWKPTKQELQMAESLMQNYINANKSLENLDTYTRQYVGLIEKNKKVILIEGFCVSPKLFRHDPNWKKEVIRVDDGGACFFSIKVDLDLKECYGFGINVVG